MDFNSIEGIEDHIRNIALTKRIRPTEFFIDYDQLRSGFVTASQFGRVIWENLGVKLDDLHLKLLAQKYDLRRDGQTLCYRAFCEVINRSIDPNNMNVDLATQVQHNGPQNLLGTCRSVQPLSPRSENQVLQLLQQLQSYYKKHGISLLKCCEDFDRHHIGVIQESQFYRCFPHPSEVNADDITKLVKRYADPTRPGMVNYVNMHRDIESFEDIKAAKISDVQEPLKKLTKPSYSGVLGEKDTHEILEKIKAAAQRSRVRTTEFFKDFDKLHSGIITEPQFLSALSLSIGREAKLSQAEIQKVIEFYRVDEGRVNYRDFCSMVENAFTIPELEKRPLAEVPTLATDALGRNLPQLSDAEECRVSEVLEALAEQVRKLRIQLLPYFQDYEKGTGYRRVVSPTQFYRVLQFANLNVAPEDLKLLVRKFTEPLTGDINYTDFVHIIDHEFTEKNSGVKYTNLEDEKRCGNTEKKCAKENVAPAVESEKIEETLARIRNLVFTTRRRVIDYFQDYDQLRSGSITKNQFRRALSDLGVNSLGAYNISNSQFEALAKYYCNPKMPDKVIWVQFMKDIESVISPPDLEKMPTLSVPSHDMFVLPKAGTINWTHASDDHRALCDKAMQRLQNIVKQKRRPVKPTFQDFDKHNNGHVTRKQFRQTLSMVELPISEAEMQALEAKFCNDHGFNYMAFLAELQPEEPVPFMYLERMKELRQVNDKAMLPEHNPAPSLEALLDKLRTKVFKERIRVYEWMKDYDKLHVGRIPRANFQRAIDLCKFELSKSEIALLLDHYGYNGLDVEYLRFCEDIEAIFAKAELEKMPLIEPDKAKPFGNWTQTKELPVSQLSPEKDNVAHSCLLKIAESVRKTRLQLYPLFEDFDRIHNGTVTINQFRRVLMQLELASYVRGEYEWECLLGKFTVKNGGQDVVNYVSFCDGVYELANFEWRKP